VRRTLHCAIMTRTSNPARLRFRLAHLSTTSLLPRHPEEIEEKPSTLAPKSDEPTVLIPIEQQIQQRAYERYEQHGRTDGHDLDDWLQAECEIKGTQANAAVA
jgi:hypothetical protein